MSEGKYPSVEYLRQCFREENGKLFWLQRPREHFSSQQSFVATNVRCFKKEAGCAATNKGDKISRWMIRLNGRSIRRYAIVWALHHGEWRVGIDHKNRDSLDDSIGNLRIATQQQNIANQGRNSRNTSGYKGVSWDKSKKAWIASIEVEGKYKNLGRFQDPADAHKVYCEAATKFFGEFACFG